MTTPGSPHETSVVKAHTAPDARDPRKPEGLGPVLKPAWRYILMRAIREFLRDKSTVLAAALTFYMLLGLFTALLELMSVIGLFGLTGTAVSFIDEMATHLADPTFAETLRNTVQQLGESSGAGTAFVVGLLGALWSASGYVNCFSHAMNTVYEIDEGRPFWKLRPIMMLWTIVLLVLMLVIFAILALSGPVASAVGGLIGLGDASLAVWSVARWPIVLLVVIVMIAVLFYGTPNVKLPKFKWMTLGAFIALFVTGVASAGFFFYVANFTSYERLYGSVAGVIIGLLWLWIVNLALLFGAQCDAEIERVRQLRGGIPAEQSIQLPPRDTKASAKRLEQIEKDVAKGRELRNGAVD